MQWQQWCPASWEGSGQDPGKQYLLLTLEAFFCTATFVSFHFTMLLWNVHLAGTVERSPAQEKAAVCAYICSLWRLWGWGVQWQWHELWGGNKPRCFWLQCGEWVATSGVEGSSREAKALDEHGQKVAGNALAHCCLDKCDVTYLQWLLSAHFPRSTPPYLQCIVCCAYTAVS